MPNILYPTDVEASDRWFVAEVTDPPVRCHDGVLSLQDGPGLGVALDPEVVGRYRVRQWSASLSCCLAVEPDAPQGYLYPTPLR